MDNPPLISVYIPTRNRANKLQRAIDSVLRQTYKNFEVIICDDASTDETESIIKELADKNAKIRYIRNKTPEGACSARNRGIFAAKGEFITGLDDDDEFTSNRLELLINNWKDEYSFICTNFTEVRSANKKTYYGVRNRKFTLDELLVSNEASNQVFTRTERMRAIGGFNINVKKLQDWDTWIRLCSKYGDFLRLGTSQYIMHHDHAPKAPRVSSSIPAYQALNELCDRNIALYNKKTEFVIRSYSRFLQKKFTIKDMVINFIYKPSMRPIIRFLFQKVRSDDSK